MNKTTEALKMAIELLEKALLFRQEAEHCLTDSDYELNGFLGELDAFIYVRGEKAINACREALSQEQEPVAYNFEGVLFFANEASHYMKDAGDALYTHPAQPLSDDEIEKLIPDTTAFKCETPVDECVDFARAIEQAHGIGVKE